MNGHIDRFSVMHTDGDDEDVEPDDADAALARLYDELATSTPEHGDVGVTHGASGWYLSAHRDRRVVLENLGEDGSAQHMLPVDREHTLRLWKLLIAGDIHALRQEPWKPGYRL